MPVNFSSNYQGGAQTPVYDYQDKTAGAGDAFAAGFQGVQDQQAKQRAEQREQRQFELASRLQEENLLTKQFDRKKRMYEAGQRQIKINRGKDLLLGNDISISQNNKKSDMQNTMDIANMIKGKPVSKGSIFPEGLNYTDDELIAVGDSFIAEQGKVDSNVNLASTLVLNNEDFDSTINEEVYDVASSISENGYKIGAYNSATKSFDAIVEVDNGDGTTREVTVKGADFKTYFENVAANGSFSTIAERLEDRNSNMKTLNLGNNVTQAQFDSILNEAGQEFVNEKTRRSFINSLGDPSKISEILADGEVTEKEALDAFSALMTNKYGDQIQEAGPDYKSLTEKNKYLKSLIDLNKARAGSGEGSSTIAGVYQHYANQLQQGDSSFLNTSVRKALDDPNATTNLVGDNLQVLSSVSSEEDAVLKVKEGRTLRLANGAEVDSNNVDQYNAEDLIGAQYVIENYDLNSDAGNSAVLQLYGQGLGLGAKDYGELITQLGQVKGGAGIITPEIAKTNELNILKNNLAIEKDPTKKEAIQNQIDTLEGKIKLGGANAQVAEAIKNPKLNSKEVSEFEEEIANPKKRQTALGQTSYAFKQIIKGTDGKGIVPYFLADFGSTVGAENMNKMLDLVETKINEINAAQGTDYTLADVLENTTYIPKNILKERIGSPKDTDFRKKYDY